MYVVYELVDEVGYTEDEVQAYRERFRAPNSQKSE
jgi:hypothetical protein